MDPFLAYALWLPVAGLALACDTAEPPLTPSSGPEASRPTGASSHDNMLNRITPPAMREFRARMAKAAVRRAPSAAALLANLTPTLTISQPLDLGASFPGTRSFGSGINAQGQVAGGTGGPISEFPVNQAVRWGADGVPTVLTVASNDLESMALGINDAGTSVGSWTTKFNDEFPSRHLHAIAWGADGSRTELPGLPVAGDTRDSHVAQAVNNHGVIVGWASVSTGDFAVRWDAEGVHQLEGEGGSAYDINDAGVIAGYVQSGALMAAKWSPSGALTVLPLPTGTEFAFAQGINNLGQIVGSAGIYASPMSTRPVIWAPDGTPTVIPGPSAAQGFKINDAGIVAGAMDDGTLGPDPAVLWYGGTAVPVPPLEPGLAVVNDLSETQLVGQIDADRTSLTFRAARWDFSTTTLAHFDFAGFLRPVAGPGSSAPYTINRVTAGRSVPIRFSLHGNQGLGILAAGSPASKPVACTLSDAAGGDPTRAAGHTALTYHAGGDRYQYIWKTDRAWAGTCRQLDITLTDGTTHSALFRFR